MIRSFRSFFIVVLLAGLAPQPGVAQESQSEYLRGGDEVILRVWPDTTLSGRYRVEADGHAYLPLVGKTPVVGRSLEEIREELVAEYAEVMRSPVVVIVPRFRVSVLGGVRAPGLYFVEPPTTLMDLVSMAGGFTNTAESEKIRLLRGGRVFGVDARNALRTGSETAAVPLQSGDQVVVPTAGGRGFRIFQIVVSLATLGISLVRIF